MVDLLLVRIMALITDQERAKTIIRQLCNLRNFAEFTQLKTKINTGQPTQHNHYANILGNVIFCIRTRFVDAKRLLLGTGNCC